MILFLQVGEYKYYLNIAARAVFPGETARSLSPSISDNKFARGNYYPFCLYRVQVMASEYLSLTNIYLVEFCSFYLVKSYFDVINIAEDIEINVLLANEIRHGFHHELTTLFSTSLFQFTSCRRCKSLSSRNFQKALITSLKMCKLFAIRQTCNHRNSSIWSFAGYVHHFNLK